MLPLTGDVQPSPLMQRNQSQQQHEPTEQVMIEDDPLMIAQTLTYVTDDGDTILTFNSAPLSTGEQCSILRVVWYQRP